MVTFASLFALYHAPRGKPLLAGGQHGSIRFQLHAGHLDAIEKLAVSVRLAYLKLALQGLISRCSVLAIASPTGVVTQCCCYATLALS